MYKYFFPLLFLAIVVNGRGYTGSFHTRGSESLYVTNVNIGGVEVARLLSTRLRNSNVRNAIVGSDFERNGYWVQSRLGEMHGLGSDEAGHYLSPKLGGPPDFWNLFPKTTRGNGDFEVLERDLAAYLQYNCGDIQWDLNIKYEDPSRPRRPSTFKLDLVYYDHDGAHCHKESNSFANYPTYSPKGSTAYRSDFSSFWGSNHGGGRSFERPYCPICLHGRRSEIKARPVPPLSVRSLSSYPVPVPKTPPQSPLPLLSSPYHAENTVRVFAHSDFWGQNATLQPHLNQCLNIDYDLYKRISSLMVTQGSCVTFYEENNCQGHRFNQEAGVRDNLENFPDWQLRAGHKTWNDVISSVSGCSSTQPQLTLYPYTRSEPITEIRRPSPVTEHEVNVVDLYEHKEYRGSYTRVRVFEGACTDVPFDYHHVVSSLNSQGGCIMLWEFVGCRGASRVEVVGRNPNLTQVRTQPGSYSRHWNDNVKAISTCNF